MRIYNWEEYYSVLEIAEMIGESTGSIYYHLKRNKDIFPQPTIINDARHWNIEGVKAIKEYFDTRAWRKNQMSYILSESESSKLRKENKILKQEVKNLKKKLRKEV